MHDHVNEHGIPVSSGFPPLVRLSAVIGLIAIFVMGGLVVLNSSGNHVWPSTDSVNVPLESSMK